MNCFHSISFPSEWGRGESKGDQVRKDDVSIQLVSPASGDAEMAAAKAEVKASFHSISFPSEWGPDECPRTHGGGRFPFN